MKRLCYSVLAAAALAGCGESPASVVPQVRPVEGGFVSSWFGPRPVHPLKGLTPGGRHDGYDFAVAAGAPIRASMAGVVGYAGGLGGYGRSVVLNHPGGYSTLYGHASTLLVKPGQRVAPGDVIAKVGSTGLSTGPHLHYELRHHGVAVDPGAFSAQAAVARVADVQRPAVRKLTAKQQGALKSGRSPSRTGSAPR